MKLLTGWVMSAGLVVAASAAQAQVLAPYGIEGSPYAVVSDIGGPYAAMPPEMPVRGYGPRLLPPQEVYTVLRESGFSPLGIPARRGVFYTISVIDRGGDDGRLVIDARDGRIVRFMPANRIGDRFDDALVIHGQPGPPPAAALRGEPRPPRSAPKVASRTTAVPVPKPSPRTGEAKPLAAKPATVQPAPAAAVKSAAAVPAKPAVPQTSGPAAAAATPAAAEAKPAPQILPTQDMPTVQGLE
jgi:hypothetical protein